MLQMNYLINGGADRLIDGGMAAPNTIYIHRTSSEDVARRMAFIAMQPRTGGHLTQGPLIFSSQMRKNVKNVININILINICFL